MDKLSGRLGVYLVGLASIVVILFGIRGSAYILNPILLATVLTITVLPIPSRLTKRGIPGWLALVLSIGMVALVLGLVIVIIFVSITRLSTELPQYLADATQQYAADTAGLTGSDVSVESVEVSTQPGEITQSILAGVFGVMAQMGIALIIFIFMISSAISLPRPSRLGLDPDMPVIGRVAHLTEDVRKYMSVLTGINLLVGLGDTIFLFIVGVDYAVLWGLLAWFMGYIPSIGFLIALIPPVLMAYAQFGWQTALIVLVGYILINGSVENFIKPKQMGDRLSISPLVVFVGLFIWGYLLGGIGAILAVPLTLLVIIIMENFEGTRTIARLMRYTGDTDREEQQEALHHVRGLWVKTKETFLSQKKGPEGRD